MSERKLTLNIQVEISNKDGWLGLEDYQDAYGTSDLTSTVQAIIDDEFQGNAIQYIDEVFASGGRSLLVSASELSIIDLAIEEIKVGVANSSTESYGLKVTNYSLGERVMILAKLGQEGYTALGSEHYITCNKNGGYPDEDEFDNKTDVAIEYLRQIPLHLKNGDHHGKHIKHFVDMAIKALDA
ncbi:hypothetical protein [Vibrio atlanticus]|uniref:Uncharacterized protein n=1 Tax=Vibrio atlanticus TaxID=693153 RepID=A0A1C3IVR8_9VIBR|nr:hypothetical protein [Vibrio atlanticus]SBS65516.1 hypothetical protein VAT7223_02747 [Vibrio atlanticus]